MYQEINDLVKSGQAGREMPPLVAARVSSNLTPAMLGG